MNWLYARRKAIVAVVGAGLTAAAGLGLSGAAQQWLTIALAVVTAAGVYGVRNADEPVPPVARHIKAPGDVRPALKAAIRTEQRGGRLM